MCGVERVHMIQNAAAPVVFQELTRAQLSSSLFTGCKLMLVSNHQYSHSKLSLALLRHTFTQSYTLKLASEPCGHHRRPRNLSPAHSHIHCYFLLKRVVSLTVLNKNLLVQCRSAVCVMCSVSQQFSSSLLSRQS